MRCGRERSEAEAGAKRTLRRFEMGYPPLAPPHQHPARSRQLHHTGVAGSITAERQRESDRKRLALRLLTPRMRLRMGWPLTRPREQLEGGDAARGINARTLKIK